jgi:hypothetical protein
MIEDFLHLPPVSTFSCEYLREFSKKFETALMIYSGDWGKLIHEKTRIRKSRDTVPLSNAWMLDYIQKAHNFVYF